MAPRSGARPPTRSLADSRLIGRARGRAALFPAVSRDRVPTMRLERPKTGPCSATTLATIAQTLQAARTSFTSIPGYSRSSSVRASSVVGCPRAQDPDGKPGYDRVLVHASTGSCSRHGFRCAAWSQASAACSGHEVRPDLAHRDRGTGPRIINVPAKRRRNLFAARVPGQWRVAGGFHTPGAIHRRLQRRLQRVLLPLPDQVFR